MKHIFCPATVMLAHLPRSLAPLLGAAGLLTVMDSARATQKEFTGSTSWLAAGNWTPNGVPGAGDNVIVDTGAGGAYTINAGTLTVQDINFTLATTSSLSNTASTASTLTLNGGRGSSTPLFDENSTKTFTIKNGSTAALNLVLAVSGSFQIDSTGGLIISSSIGQTGGAQSLSITGAGSGAVTLSGVNSFSGGLVALGAEVDVSGDTSLGAAGGSVTINGGRVGFATNSFTVDAARNIYLGANPTGGNNTGTLSIKGSITTTFNQGFQNLTGSAGDLVKQGGGTLALGGVSTYSGNTFLNNGITQLTTGNDRLPTGTTVALGQTGSANVGTLDLNGFNQQIAGLNSTNATTGAPMAKNTVTTSTTAATLTFGGTGTYTYGDGSAANSGVLTGALTINKTGTGTQTFGDANTYTGSTTISGGTLKIDSAGSTTPRLANTTQILINSGGTLLTSNSVTATSSTDRINNAATVKIAGGGTLNTGSLSEGIRPSGPAATDGTAGLGALTLTGTSGAPSNIDFGSATAGSSLVFSNLDPASKGAYVSILNWGGTPGADDGTSTYDRLLFAADPGFTNADLAKYSFNGFGPGATEIAYGNEFEIVPTAVPELGTMLGGALLAGVTAWSQRRRVRLLLSAC